MKGRINRGLSQEYKHLSLYVSLSDWDKLNYLADGENKTVSRYIVDTILNSDKEPREIIPTEKRGCKPLCFKIAELEEIKRRAEKAGFSMSNYILGMLL